MRIKENGKYTLSEPIYVCYITCYDIGAKDGDKPHSFYIKELSGICLYRVGNYHSIGGCGPYTSENVKAMLRSGKKIYGLAYVRDNDTIRILGQVKRFDILKESMSSSEAFQKFLQYAEYSNHSTNFKLVLERLSKDDCKVIKAFLGCDKR